MSRVDRLYWLFEGFLLGSLMVVITLPAVLIAFAETPMLSVGYVISLVVAVACTWFYVSWRVLDRQTVEAVDSESFDSC